MEEARLPKTAPSAVSPIHHQTSVGRLGELEPARRGEPACPVGGSAGVEVAAQREADAEERDRETAGGAGVRAELCGHGRHRAEHQSRRGECRRQGEGRRRAAADGQGDEEAHHAECHRRQRGHTDRHRQAGPATEHTGGHQLGLPRVLVGAAVADHDQYRHDPGEQGTELAGPPGVEPVGREQVPGRPEDQRQRGVGAEGRGQRPPLLDAGEDPRVRQDRGGGQGGDEQDPGHDVPHILLQGDPQQRAGPGERGRHRAGSAPGWDDPRLPLPLSLAPMSSSPSSSSRS